jgi:receptor protein-tyrosine kinase
VNEGPRYVTFRDYLRVVREHRVLVIMMVLLFGGAAVLYSVRQQPVYSAESSLEFRDDSADAAILGRGTGTGVQTPEQRAAINSQTVTTREVAERVKKSTRSPLAVEQIQALAQARPEARTNLVVIEAHGRTGRRAADLANAYAGAARDVKREEIRDAYDRAADASRQILEDLGHNRAGGFQRQQVRRDIATYEELAKIADPVVIRRRAGVPGSPIRPKPVRTTLLGLLIGLTLGLVAAFVRDSLDRRFKSSREITEELHLPLLGYVPEEVLGHSLSSVNGRKTLTEQQLEGFRILRTNIEFLDVDHPPKLILVTSSLPEEGKSTVSSALGAAYAATGKRTLVVECDLRRPTLADRLGIRETPGLSDYLVGHATPPEVIQTIALGNQVANGNQPAGAAASVPLVAIAAGSPAPQPAELLRSKRCKDFFAQVKEVYDVVIVDTCPLLSVVDTLELLPIADAVVVCVRASQTTRDQARAAKAALSHFPDRPTGVVVTGVRARDEAGYAGYYSYGYVYGASR